MERFARVLYLRPFGKCCHSPCGRLPPAPGWGLLAGELRIPDIVLKHSVGSNRAGCGRRPCICLTIGKGVA
jgi:hypothetical protein